MWDEWVIYSKTSQPMKRFLFLLLLSSLMGCRQNDVDPADPLYRTWQRTTTTYPDGRVMTVTNATNYDIVTFRPNGTILYGANGRYAACCFPNRFRREGSKLDFTKVNSIPVPPVDNPEQCHLVDCAGSGAYWQIVTLDNTQLILETPFGNYVYQPYP